VLVKGQRYSLRDQDRLSQTLVLGADFMAHY